MYKVAILGCENSHANNFLNYVIKNKGADDIEFVGVYSDETEAMELLNKEFGVPMMKSYDELVGKVDGIIVTARHGDNHYKYAKPYIASGIPMFIDKPITCDEQEAVKFMKELKANNVRVCGGSSVVFVKTVDELAEVVKTKPHGEIMGGFLRTPVTMDNEYGNFYFYSQHLVQIMCEIFGCYPKTVRAYASDKGVSAIVRYEDFDVCCEFAEDAPVYCAFVNSYSALDGGVLDLTGIFEKEFDEYYDLLKGGEQTQTYNEIIAPVAIINAIKRSFENNTEEAVIRAEEI